MIKKARQNKQFRVFCWQLLDVVIVFGITWLTGIEGEWKLIATGLGIPVFTLISKYINKELIGDLGVEKDLPENQ